MLGCAGSSGDISHPPIRPEKVGSLELSRQAGELLDLRLLARPGRRGTARQACLCSCSHAGVLGCVWHQPAANRLLGWTAALTCYLRGFRVLVIDGEGVQHLRPDREARESVRRAGEGQRTDAGSWRHHRWLGAKKTSCQFRSICLHALTRSAAACCHNNAGGGPAKLP